MSPFQIDTRANAPQTTPRKLELLTASCLDLFGSRWEQLPGSFLGKVWVAELDYPRPGEHRDPEALLHLLKEERVALCPGNQDPPEPDDGRIMPEQGS